VSRFEARELDFADLQAGVFGLVRVEIGPRGAAAMALLLEPGEDPVAVYVTESSGITGWDKVRIGPVLVEETGEAARVTHHGESASFAAEIRATGPTARFGEANGVGAAAGASLETAPCAITGEILRGKSSKPFEAAGRRLRQLGDLDWPRLAAVRYLGIDFEDGAAVSLHAVRPSHASGHGEEAVAATLTEPGAEAAADIEKALLSTQYEPSGHHRRAGLELLLGEDATPLRAAGTEIAGHTVEAGTLRREVSFMEWRMEGRTGAGRYEVAWRGASR
jgi:hypothetical protein